MSFIKELNILHTTRNSSPRTLSTIIIKTALQKHSNLVDTASMLLQATSITGICRKQITLCALKTLSSLQMSCLGEPCISQSDSFLVSQSFCVITTHKLLVPHQSLGCSLSSNAYASGGQGSTPVHNWSSALCKPEKACRFPRQQQEVKTQGIRDHLKVCSTIKKWRWKE